MIVTIMSIVVQVEFMSIVLDVELYSMLLVAVTLPKLKYETVLFYKEDCLIQDYGLRRLFYALSSDSQDNYPHAD
mgnify:CR=1 FL=1